MLRDDPNESSAVYFLTSDDKHAVCGTDFSPIQINFFAENISDDSSLWRRLSITCQARKKIGKEKEKVSPMIISEYQRKTNLCRFCSLITPIFFFHNSLSLLNCMCIPFPEPREFEKDLPFTFYL